MKSVKDFPRARPCPCGRLEGWWHLCTRAGGQGAPPNEAPAGGPRRSLKRLRGYGPRLDPVERFRGELRRRAAPNRLFDGLAGLKESPRAGLCSFRAVRREVQSLLEPRPRETN